MGSGEKQGRVKKWRQSKRDVRRFIFIDFITSRAGRFDGFQRVRISWIESTKAISLPREG